MQSLGSDGLEMTLKLIEAEENYVLDDSKPFVHNGKVIDLNNISVSELVNLSSSVDSLDKYEALEHVRSTYLTSSPNVKLYYPEPFIASPSFIHNDIGYIHILQYQY
jgi:hypothetical protein